MARNNKKRVFAKFITRASSAAVMAVALTAALASPVHATEVDEPVITPAEPETTVEIPTAEEITSEAELQEANQTIEDSNNSVLEENEAAIEENNSVVEENSAAAEDNEEATDGALADPGLTMPEAPETPDIEGADAEDYNDAVNDYNESVDDYNAAADEYNQGVDDYNAAADAYDQQAQEQYEEALEQYKEDLDQYNSDSQAYQDYLNAKKAYDEAFAAYEAALKQYDEVDYPQYEKDLKAYNDYLAAKDAYDAAKEAYDQEVEAYEKESSIYDTVSDYNADITTQNQEISEKNEALEESIHANNVDNIDQLDERNADVEVDQSVLDVLNTYDELAAAKAELETTAAALAADERKDAELDSEEYMAYLAAVEAYNAAVAEYNEDAADYNEAVDTYNAAVEEYNENRSSSTSAGSSTDTGTADWGNINIKSDTTFGHIDVKYTAAVAINKTTVTDENGVETDVYEEDVSSYDVSGVYVSKDAAEADPDSYALNYVNSAGGETQTQGLTKEDTEFRTTEEGNGKGGEKNEQTKDETTVRTALDPDDGTITFYMTLVDEDGNTYGIDVTLEDTDVYPEGTYFAGTDNGQIASYLNSEGKPLETVVINGTTYYNVSGQSVFVISALVCNGAKTEKDGTVNTDGLDLVLNVQTLIEIHKSDNAQTLSYLSYEYGITAQAEAPTEPTFDKTEPTPVEEPTPPDPPTFDMDEPDRVDDPGDAPVEPTAPVPVTRLNYVVKLDQLTEKLIVNLDFGDLIPEGSGSDKDVPLAEAPKTGDMSALWGTLSALSLGGITLLNRKREDEE